MKGKPKEFTRRQAVTAVASLLLTIAGISSFIFNTFYEMAQGVTSGVPSGDWFGAGSVLAGLAMALWDTHLERRKRGGLPPVLLDDDSWVRAYVVLTTVVLAFLFLFWTSLIGGLLVEQRDAQDRMMAMLRHQNAVLAGLQDRLAPPAPAPAAKPRARR